MYKIIDKSSIILHKYSILNIDLSPFLRNTPMLFHFLCDLISYELFFRNDLPADCLSDSELQWQWRKNSEWLRNWSIRNEITNIRFMRFAAV